MAGLGCFEILPEHSSTSRHHLLGLRSTVQMPAAKTQGKIKAGEGRIGGPIEIYYELHGNGKNRVMLVMGKLNVFRS
jgi:hypothetical protein